MAYKNLAEMMQTAGQLLPAVQRLCIRQFIKGSKDFPAVTRTAELLLNVE